MLHYYFLLYDLLFIGLELAVWQHNFPFIVARPLYRCNELQKQHEKGDSTCQNFLMHLLAKNQTPESSIKEVHIEHTKEESAVKLVLIPKD